MQPGSYYSKRWQQVPHPAAISARASRLLQAQSGSSARCALHLILKACLEAGSAVEGLACSLAAAPSVLALQELSTLSPAREWSGVAAIAASAEGHVEILQWIADEREPMDPVECAIVAAVWGSQDILDWLLHLPVMGLAGSIAPQGWLNSVWNFIFHMTEREGFGALQTLQSVWWPGFEPNEVSLWARTQSFIEVLDWLHITQAAPSQNALAAELLQ